VGAGDSASGFPLGGGLAQQLGLVVPGVKNRLKKIPRPISDTAGDVLGKRLDPFSRSV
jgi:hypothetical protein